MTTLLSNDSGEVSPLLQRAKAGDQQALSELFARYESRLKRMIRLRLNRALQGRIDDADVMQEVYMEATQRLGEYLQQPKLPFFLWLRLIAGQKLIDVHRRHLAARMRDASREVSLHHGPWPEASSASLAAHLLGRLTSPSQKAIKAELRIRLQEALNSMEFMDREVLVLRHFEQLDNHEVAQVLGMSPSGASSRYLRACKRLKGILSDIPGFFEK